MKKYFVLLTAVISTLCLASCNFIDNDDSNSNDEFPWSEFEENIDYGAKVSIDDAEDILNEIEQYLMEEFMQGYSALEFPYFTQTQVINTKNDLNPDGAYSHGIFQYSIPDFYTYDEVLALNTTVQTQIPSPSVSNTHLDVYGQCDMLKTEDWTFKDNNQLIDVSTSNSSVIYYYDEDGNLVDFEESYDNESAYASEWDEESFLAAIDDEFSPLISIAFNSMEMIKSIIDTYSNFGIENIPGVELYSDGDGNLLLYQDYSEMGMGIAQIDTKMAYYFENYLPRMTYMYSKTEETGELETYITYNFDEFTPTRPSYTLEDY